VNLFILLEVYLFSLKLTMSHSKRKESALYSMALACGADGRCATDVSASTFIHDIEIVNIRDQRLEQLEN